MRPVEEKDGHTATASTIDTGAVEDDALDWDYSYQFTPSSVAARSAYRRLLFKLWFYKSRFLTIDSWRPMWTGQEGVANLYFIAWFALNIVITLSSKAMFSNFKFPYPMMLTAVHCAVTGLGSQLAAWLGTYKAVRITPQQLAGLGVFSLVFTVNIWLSNYALLVVSVAVHQVFRTTIPLFTMILSLTLYKEVYPLRMLPSVLLVIAGVAATVWGDMEMTFYGGLVVCIGCAFSSLKGLMSQKAQIGAQGLETFDLLRAVCPLAVLELIILGLFNGEVVSLLNDSQFTSATAWNLLVQGLIAFSLNFVSFKCAALKNPLTMTIAGNIKQVVTPLLALWIFGGALTSSLVLGLVIATAGALWYSEEARLRKDALKTAIVKSEEDLELAATDMSALAVSVARTDKREAQLHTGDGATALTETAQVVAPATIGSTMPLDQFKSRKIEVQGRTISTKTIIPNAS
eukprot:Gregarina_sp_Pseudo_9__4123@NODE_426_length_2857_cov_41_985806_g403_i0_p1_GENE_NODE_426_length_2857_cov_41_985806_g403_i0NODE_426_length_2857_cov_41_985806_g403_i0_p1_ORF_typecomplete_len460_score115_72TPT/PF03151_16/1_7e55UAA/PF08449_11/7_4e19EamA/PF00892_20/6_6e06EamA/PF00892_20/0_067SLC35F/PF06027_12/2_1e03SLC35F/PF06027_12/3_4e05SLC35F/PF06027_12/12CRTlike/PF08627_10/0_00086Nuc_sug_transp/PF04142_15/0_0025TMP_2/PF06791_13/0_043PUNUT/PF16913_5/5_9_NODE_426_length_2857_cov_41_985806_g403_i0127